MVCSYKDTSYYPWDFSYFSWMLSALFKTRRRSIKLVVHSIIMGKPLNELENSDSKSEFRASPAFPWDNRSPNGGASALCPCPVHRSLDEEWGVRSIQLPRCTASRRWRTKAPSFFGGLHPTTLVAVSFGFSSSSLSAPSVISAYCLQRPSKWKILYFVFKGSMKREGQCLRKAPLY